MGVSENRTVVQVSWRGRPGDFPPGRNHVAYVYIYLGEGCYYRFRLSGIILFIMGSRRVWRRKMVAGSLEVLVGLLLLAIAALMSAISINLYTYDRLTHESAIAEVSFQEIGPNTLELL